VGPSSARHSAAWITSLLVAALLLGPGGAAAQASSGAVQDQFWPEIDYYQSLSKVSRLLFQALAATGANDVADNAQFGVNLDLFLKPRSIYKPLAVGAASLVDDRYHPYMLRLGYRYTEPVNGSSTAIQNRLLAEFSVKYNFFGAFTAERNSFDWRWTNGVYSTRYRNRVYSEYPIDIDKYQLTPYAQSEWFYNLTKGAWAGVQYEAGVQLPVFRHVTSSVYLARQNNWGTSQPDQVAIGLTVTLSY